MGNAVFFGGKQYFLVLFGFGIAARRKIAEQTPFYVVGIIPDFRLSKPLQSLIKPFLAAYEGRKNADDFVLLRFA